MKHLPQKRKTAKIRLKRHQKNKMNNKRLFFSYAVYDNASYLNTSKLLIVKISFIKSNVNFITKDTPKITIPRQIHTDWNNLLLQEKNKDNNSSSPALRHSISLHQNKKLVFFLFFFLFL